MIHAQYRVWVINHNHNIYEVHMSRYKVLARGKVDEALELRVFKNEDEEYEIRAFFYDRYISDEYFSNYETDLESAIGTMNAEVKWHIANPDFIGNTDKFDIRCS